MSITSIMFSMDLRSIFTSKLIFQAPSLGARLDRNIGGESHTHLQGDWTVNAYNDVSLLVLASSQTALVNKRISNRT